MADLIAYLVSKGVVGFLAMDTAVQHMRNVGGRLTSSILDTTNTAPDALLQATAECYGIGYATDDLLANVDGDAFEFWHQDKAFRLGAIPLAIEPTGVLIGVLEPLSEAQLDEIKEEYGQNITQLLILEFRFFELCHRHYHAARDERYAVWSRKYPLQAVERAGFNLSDFDDEAYAPAEEKDPPAFFDPFQDLFQPTPKTASPKDTTTSETHITDDLRDATTGAVPLDPELRSDASTMVTGMGEALPPQYWDPNAQADESPQPTMDVDILRDAPDQDKNRQPTPSQERDDDAFFDAPIFGSEESFHEAFDIGGDVGWQPEGKFSAHARTDAAPRSLPTTDTDGMDHRAFADTNLRPETTAPTPLPEQGDSPSEEYSDEDSGLSVPFLQAESALRHDSLDPVIHPAPRISRGMEPLAPVQMSTEGGSSPRLVTGMIMEEDLHDAWDDLEDFPLPPIELARNLGFVDEQGTWRPAKNHFDTLRESAPLDETLSAVELMTRFQDARSAFELIDLCLQYFGQYFKRRFLVHFWAPRKSSGLHMRGVEGNSSHFTNVEIPYDGTSTVFKARQTRHYLQGGPVEIGFQTLYSRLGIVKSPEIIGVPLILDEHVTMMLLMDNGPNELVGRRISVSEITHVLQQLATSLMHLAARNVVSKSQRGEIPTPVDGTPALSKEEIGIPADDPALQPRLVSRTFSPHELIDDDLLNEPPIPSTASRQLEAAMDSMEMQTVEADETDVDLQLDSVEHFFNTREPKPKVTSTASPNPLLEGSTSESGSLEIEVRPDQDLSPAVKALLEQDTLHNDQRAVSIIVSDDERSADDLALDLLPPTEFERQRFDTQETLSDDEGSGARRITDDTAPQSPVEEQDDATQLTPAARPDMDELQAQRPSHDTPPSGTLALPPEAIKPTEDKSAGTDAQKPLTAEERRAAIIAKRNKKTWQPQEIAKLLNVDTEGAEQSDATTADDPSAIDALETPSEAQIQDTAEQDADANIGDTAQQETDAALADQTLGDTAEQDADANIGDTAQQETDAAWSDGSEQQGVAKNIHPSEDNRPIEEEDAFLDSENFTELFAPLEALADDTEQPAANEKDDEAHAEAEDEKEPEDEPKEVVHFSQENARRLRALFAQQRGGTAKQEPLSAKENASLFAAEAHADEETESSTELLFVADVETTKDEAKIQPSRKTSKSRQLPPSDDEESNGTGDTAPQPTRLRSARTAPTRTDVESHHSEVLISSDNEGQRRRNTQTVIVGNIPGTQDSGQFPLPSSDAAAGFTLPPPPPQAADIPEISSNDLEEVLEEVGSELSPSLTQRVVEALVEQVEPAQARPAATLQKLEDLTEAERRQPTAVVDQVDPTLEALLHGDPSSQQAALNMLSVVAADELPSIVSVFPGPLLLNRYDEEETLRPLAQHGPLLALVDARLHDYLPQIWDCLERRSSDARYYALRFLSLIRELELHYVLMEAVFDEDPQVRQLAIRLIESHRSSGDFPIALETFQARTKDVLAENREAAVFALVYLGDSTSIPRLIDMLEDPAPLVRQRAREGLMRLTYNDKGTSKDSWVEWFRLHGNDVPEQWLVEAMDAIEPLRRELAARALRKISGLVVNYHPEMSPQGLQRARMVVERFYQLRR